MEYLANILEQFNHCYWHDVCVLVIVLYLTLVFNTMFCGHHLSTVKHPALGEFMRVQCFLSRVIPENHVDEAK